MATFPQRNKEEEAGQLLDTFPHSLINLSADLYNALARATIRKMGESKVKRVTMQTLREIEAACYKENPRTSVVVIPRRGAKVYLRLVALAIEPQRDSPWEQGVLVKVLFPITCCGETQEFRDQERFLELLLESTRIFGAVENGGVVVRVMLFGNDVPIERENPDDRHGKAWKYFVRRGEVI